MPRIIHQAITEHDGDIARDGSTAIRETLTLVVDNDVSLEWIKANIAPQLNREHPEHSGYYFERINPKRTGKLTWVVALVASPFQFENLPENPLARRAVITADGQLTSEPTNFDYKGRPITTTAGEFLGGVERDRATAVYHVSKNVAQDPEWFDTHIGAVNTDSVRLRNRVRPPGTLKLINPSLSDYTVENKTRFCVVSFDLVFDPLGHAQERWNMGTIELNKFTFQGKTTWYQRRIFSGTPPQPVSEPVALDRKGEAIQDYLKSSSDGRPVDVSKLIKLTFDVQPQLPFNGVLPLQ